MTSSFGLVFCFLESQQFISVIFVLLLSCIDFRRQTDIKVRTDGIEVIQNIDKSLLHIKRWNRKL